MLVVSRRHEFASARNQDVASGQDRIAAPENKRKPGVKPGAGLRGNPNNKQPTTLPVVRSGVDPSLQLGRSVGICESISIKVLAVMTVMTVMTIIKKCHDC